MPLRSKRDRGPSRAGPDLPEDLEASYYVARAFDREHNRRVRSYYLQFVENRKFLVELGPGRGEFLALAAAKVGRVLGIDRDPAMVDEVRAQGIEAVRQDALEYLRTTTDSPDVIMAAHLLEHLTVAQTLDLLVRASSVLERGGVIVLVTPNPACLAVMLQDFWSDPTHVRPYTLPLLEFLAEQAGLTVRATGTNPLDIPGPPPELLVPDELEAWGASPPTLEPVHGVDVTDELADVREELRRLRQGMESIGHFVAVLSEWVDRTRHQAALASRGVNSALVHLFGPNEIFVVAERDK
jgi:hypothetical protein